MRQIDKANLNNGNRVCSHCFGAYGMSKHDAHKADFVSLGSVE